MEIFGVALSGVLAALAWGVARARPEHRPVALFVTIALAADLVHWTLAIFVLAPARAALGAAPYGGAARVAFHAQQAAVLAYPVGLAALALVVFTKRRAWPVATVYGALLAAVALSYPGLRGRALELAYHRVDLAVVLFTFGVFATWWWKREQPTITMGSALTLAAMQGGKLLAHRDPFREWTSFASVLYLIAYGALTVAHVGELWPRRSSV